MNEKSQFIQRLQQYEDNNDWIGFANQLSRTHFTDGKKQAMLQGKIQELRSQARFREGMNSIADGQQKDAIAFLSAYKSNSQLPNIKGYNTPQGETDNYYSTAMHDELQALGGTDAVSLSIQFAPQKVKRKGWFGIDWLAKDAEFANDGFEDFLKILGTDANTLKQQGVDITKTSNGLNTISFSKTNPLALEYINALGKLKDDEQGVGYRYKIAGLNSEGAMIDRESNQAYDSGIDERTDYQKAENWLDDNNDYYEHPENHFAFSNALDFEDNHWFKEMSGIDKIKDIVASAEKKQDELYQGYNDDGDKKEITFSGRVYPYLNLNDLELQKKATMGQLSSEEYNMLHKMEVDKMESLVKGISLAQFKVYSTGIELGEGKGFEEVPNSEAKNIIQTLINNAVGTDKISYAIYTSGDESGIQITINGKIKNGANKDGTKNVSNNVDDVESTPLKIFIVDDGSFHTEDVLNQDTKYRTTKEMSKAAAYGYDLRIPNVGYLKPNRNEKGTVTWSFRGKDDENYIPINTDLAEKYINSMLITEDAIDNLNHMMYNESGELRKNVFNSDGSINDSFKSTIKDYAERLATGAMSELYPQAYADYENLKKQLSNLSPDSDAAKLLLSQNALILDNLDIFNNERFKMVDNILRGIGYNDGQFTGMSDFNFIR